MHDIQMMITRRSTNKMVLEIDPLFQRDEHHLTFEQRKWIISKRLDGLEVKTIIEKWQYDRHPPSEVAIYNLIKKVKDTGSVKDKPGRGGKMTCDTPQNRAEVVEYVEKYRHVSLREVVDELNFSKSFIQRVLVEECFREY